MKQIFQLLITFLLILSASSCKSHKEAAGQPQSQQIEAEEARWSNVTVPVRLSVASPVKLSFNGTATLVRGRYVLISLRMLGFEVGSVYLTPQEADVVVKQLSKIWVHEPVADRLKAARLDFTTLQEAMLGNRELLSRLPEEAGVKVGGTEASPELTVNTVVKKMPVQASLTLNLGSAKWDVDEPATFRTPGADYRKVSLEQALKALGGGR